MRPFSKLVIFSVAFLAWSCSQEGKGTDADATGRAVYFWKTTFDLSESERSFLSEHEIDRLYLRLFDVALEMNYMADSLEVVPIATTRFISKVPEGIEIIPTVFITLEAMRQYSSNEEELARLITTRVLNMCSYNDLGEIHEVQFDCDWTESTAESYRTLCESAMKILHAQGILLSGTIRLHQIEDAIYPFDKGVVMLYNTGSIKDKSTSNSILSYNDVRKYLGVQSRIARFNDARRTNCRTIDVAYPLFSWAVVFRADGRFAGLLRRDDFSDIEHISLGKDGRYHVDDFCWVDGEPLFKGSSIRIEHSDIAEVLRVKTLADSTIMKDGGSSILYHLDTKTISNYSDHDIEKILR